MRFSTSLREAALVVAFIFFVLTGHAQISFEKGYLIDRDDQRIECFIKNVDWRNNPGKISYRVSESDSVFTATVGLVREFQVYGSYKYISAKVKIDRSPVRLADLTSERNPLWSDDYLFLRVLVEGKATLFEYSEGSLSRYFYRVGDGPINQLVYKEYLRNNRTVATNATFKQQLLNEVNCGVKETDLDNLKYENSPLSRYFLKYNVCMGGEEAVKTEKKKSLFNLKLTPGVNFSSLTFINKRPGFVGAITTESKLDNTVSARFGAEAEVVFPFNKNKFSFLVEPSYQYLKATGTIRDAYEHEISVDYNFIDVPLGIRYYMFLNENTKIFVDGFYVVAINLNSTITYPGMEINSSPCVALGTGLEINRMSAEIRYYSNRNILDEYSTLWETDFNRLSLLVGYKIIRSTHKK